MMFRFSRWPRLLLATALFAALALPAFAQQAELDALAAKVAKEISSKALNKVVVADFTIDKENRIPLGATLAREFSSSLRRAAPGAQLIGQDELLVAAQRSRLLLVDVANPRVTPWIGRVLGAQLVVTGHIRMENGAARLEIRIRDLRELDDPFASQPGREFGKMHSVIPLTAEWEQLGNRPADNPIEEIFRYDKSNGMTPPECKVCIDPRFTPEARERHVQGTVLLRVTVTPQGDAADVVGIKGLGAGLGEAALATVRNWTFTPGRLRDGTPVPTRITVEVTFRLK